jgi:hypothetical protein
VQQGVTISHRGSVYAIGRGPSYYGIWFAAAAYGQPVEWWPETPEGWQGAWARFTAIEAPSAIVSTADQPASADTGTVVTQASARQESPVGKVRRLLAPSVIAVGVLLGIIGLFPGYFGSSSLASEAEELVPHLIYLAAWVASVVLLLLGGSRPKAGALIALGASAVTFGLYFADLGTALSAGSSLVGTGLIISLAGWLVCAAGSVLAVLARRPGWPGKPGNRDAWPAVILAAVTGLGAVITFAPSWDSYTLRTASGVLASITQGNAFKNPAPVIAGEVLVMVAVVAVVVLAALWQPAKLGAALVAGAIVPMAAQAISALVQVRQPVSPLQFGVSPGQAARAGLSIVSGLTPVFWIYCAFILALALLSARMLTTPEAVSGTPASPAVLDSPPTSVPVS